MERTSKSTEGRDEPILTQEMPDAAQHPLESFLQKPTAHFLFIALIGVLVYSNTFHAPFTFDDRPNIEDNPLIKNISNIPSMFAGVAGYWASRPLLQATLALNYYFGGLDTAGYHAVNIALHLMNGILLYLLVVITGRHMGYSERNIRPLSLLSALLFTVHPVQTQTVTNIVNRSMLLVTAFYLLGIILFHKTVTVKNKRGIYIAGLLAVSFLGAASREDFATFPAMLLLYDLFFISRFRLQDAPKHWKGYLPALLSLGYTAYLVASNTYAKTGIYTGIAHAEYALTQFKVHATYLRLLLLPVNQNFYYGYPAARALFEIPTAFSLLGYLGLWAGGILLARRKPLISFSILWFLVALFPISFGVTFIKGLMLEDVIFEHRLYLPSVGLFVAAGAGIFYIWDKFGIGKRHAVALVLSVVLLLSLSTLTYARNGVWHSETSLWEDVVAKSPREPRAYFGLGNAYAYHSNDLDRAVENLLAAIRLEPYYADAHYNLGLIYMQGGLWDEAREEFTATLKANPAHTQARIFLDYIENQDKTYR